MSEVKIALQVYTNIRLGSGCNKCFFMRTALAFNYLVTSVFDVFPNIKNIIAKLCMLCLSLDSLLARENVKD